MRHGSFVDTGFGDLDFKPSSEDIKGQQLKVWEALKAGPCSTLDLRKMGIAHCAGRVMELRRQGFDILTSRAGRFALYILQGGAA
jgi:hypothetical protein